MNTREDQFRDSRSTGYSASVIKAVAVHVVVALLLFVSFSSAPEFEPAKPIVQARLVQLNSKSPATTQTNQKIAGESERTAAPSHEAEEMERKKQERQEAQEAASRAAAEKAKAEAAAAAAQAERQKQVAAARAEAEKAAKEKAEAEAKRQAEIARKRAEEEAKKKAEAAEAAKNKAAEEAKRKAAEAAKQKAAEDAKRKAAEQAKKKAEADRIAKEKREQEEARAKALSELLAEDTQYQRAQADQVGDEVAAGYEDVIRRYVSAQWRRPPTARNGMVVEVRISMLPTGQITDAVVTRSSGDAGFDQSAVQAVRNVGRIPEMQQLSRDDPATFDRKFRTTQLLFRPEDLSF